MSDSNCPNCGAPITGPSCPYCDTRFENIASMAIGKVVKVSFEHGGYTHEFDMMVESLCIDANANTTDYYGLDGSCVFSMCHPEYHANFSGRIVQNDGAVMRTRKNG